MSDDESLRRCHVVSLNATDAASGGEGGPKNAASSLPADLAVIPATRQATECKAHPAMASCGRALRDREVGCDRPGASWGGDDGPGSSCTFRC